MIGYYNNCCYVHSRNKPSDRVRGCGRGGDSPKPLTTHPVYNKEKLIEKRTQRDRRLLWHVVRSANNRRRHPLYYETKWPPRCGIDRWNGGGTLRNEAPSTVSLSFSHLLGRENIPPGVPAGGETPPVLLVQIL